MVRLKHRYLVVKILYPGAISGDRSKGLSSSSKQSNPTDLQSGSTAAQEFKFQINRPSPASLTAPYLLKYIRDTVQEIFGDHGAGLIQASLKIIYLSPSTSTIVIRVSRAHYAFVWAALSWMTSISGASSSSSLRSTADKRLGGDNCIFTVVRVCGTIRKAEEEIIRRAKADILAARRLQEYQDDPKGLTMKSYPGSLCPRDFVKSGNGGIRGAGGDSKSLAKDALDIGLSEDSNDSSDEDGIDDNDEDEIDMGVPVAREIGI